LHTNAEIVHSETYSDTLYWCINEFITIAWFANYAGEAGRSIVFSGIDIHLRVYVCLSAQKSN